jgi:ParB family transcriptional regulator, chromosome partitioning protein
MAAKHGLGRGLGALIRDTPVEAAPVVSPAATGPQMVAVAQIRPNPFQPRRVFVKEALDELVASIREHGVIEPLVVRKTDEGYELIAGERRWRASQEVGLKQVPVVVREASDREALELGLIENLQRADLNVIEEAEGYQTLADQFSLTQEEIAKRVSKGRASVANALRILSLPKEIKKFMAEGLLSAGHAKVLLGLSLEPEQCRMAERVIKDGLSVRDLERLVEHSRKITRKKVAGKEEIPSSHLVFLTDKLHQYFGTSVQVQPCRTTANGRKVKGSVQIDFYTNDDLDRILDLLGMTDRG